MGAHVRLGGMTENGWEAIGRIAKLRRERLELRQDELAQYGGPKVSTVGKFERGQANFPLRTQHQMEKALGWSRTIVEQVVNSVDAGTLTAEEWEHDLVYEDIPDMSQPREGEVEHDMLPSDPIAALGYIVRLIPPDRRAEAVGLAIRAMLPLLDTAGATQLGGDMRQGHLLERPPSDSG